MDQDIEIDVPPFFVCPISLEIMKDPVTVSTGITYDRHNIEKWLFCGKNNTCPVTKQPLSDSTDDLTPNHTLRRLIQGWCTMNASHGIQRIPTPKPPVTKSQIAKLIKDASQSPLSQLQSLRTLKSIASHSETNRRCIQSSSALPFLASLITSHDLPLPNQLEALTLLHNLHVSHSALKTLVTFTNGQIIHSLTHVMQRGTYESRAYSVLLLKSILEASDPDPDPTLQLFNLAPELFVELVQILKDQISQQATKATLQTLIQLCGLGRNRNKAVKAGGVWVVVELLLECKERKVCEMMMVVLEMMCGCAEGRAELVRHGAGIAVVSKKILRVSTTANERAVRILHCISKVSGSVVQEMAEVGVVGKLCLMLQTNSGSETKERAKEILKLAHASTRINSANSCVPGSLISYLA